MPPDDAGLVQLAQAYGVRPLLHLSTLTEDDTFSAARAEALFRSPEAQEKLAGAIVRGIRQYFIKHPPGPKARLAVLG